MRAFTAHTVAMALSLDSKWIDNLLSHNDIVGCIRVRQGVGRRLTPRGVLHVAVIADLTRSLGVPVRVACNIARALLAPTEAGTGTSAGESKQSSTRGAHDGSTVFAMTSTLDLRLDLEALERSLESRLASAVESARRPRRGRPPATRPRDSA